MIIDLKNLKKIINDLRKAKKTIAFTNGCFDILHPGHIRCLEAAKKKADVVIVGLNSDFSVRKLKGSSRPIFSQNFRANILSSLRMVDYVVIFSELTPLKLIKSVKPDFLLKGGDWSIDKVVGGRFVKSYGGSVVKAPYVKRYSTTKILNQILHDTKR